MLDKEQVKIYLGRLNCGGEVSLENLFKLHEQHRIYFPFGSISINNGYLISQDHTQFFKKIVIDHQTGVCFELNYTFYQLLKTLGFKAQLHSAQVYKKDKSLKQNQARVTQENSHMLLIVQVNSVQYLCDVGFKNGARYPIQVKPDIVTHAQIQLKFYDNYYHLMKIGKNPSYYYRFNMIPRGIEVYKQNFEYYNNHSRSFVRQCTFATSCTPEGMKILMGTVFKHFNEITQTFDIILENLSIQECLEILHNEFNLKIDTYNPIELNQMPDQDLEVVEVQDEVNIHN